MLNKELNLNGLTPILIIMKHTISGTMFHVIIIEIIKYLYKTKFFIFFFKLIKKN